MKPKQQFIIQTLQRRANAILGFIVIQSIFLSHQFSMEGVMEKIESIPNMRTMILISHVFLVVASIILIVLIERKLFGYLDKDLKRALNPFTNAAVKIAVVILFGTIPIYILYSVVSLN